MWNKTTLFHKDCLTSLKGEQRAAFLHWDLGGWQERNWVPRRDFKVVGLQVGFVDHPDILRRNSNDPGAHGMFPISLWHLRPDEVVQLRGWTIPEQPTLQNLHPGQQRRLPDWVHLGGGVHAGEVGELQDGAVHEGRGDLHLLRPGLPLHPRGFQLDFSSFQRPILWGSVELAARCKKFPTPGQSGQKQAGYPWASHRS